MRKINLTVLAIALLIAPFGAAPQAADQDNSGFIYGVVTTDSGKEYRGFLRWADEEYFWDDLFHSSKDDTPYLEEYQQDHYRKKKKQEKNLEVFG